MGLGFALRDLPALTHLSTCEISIITGAAAKAQVKKPAHVTQPGGWRYFSTETSYCKVLLWIPKQKHWGHPELPAPPPRKPGNKACTHQGCNRLWIPLTWRKFCDKKINHFQPCPSFLFLGWPETLPFFPFSHKGLQEICPKMWWTVTKRH